ncbi:hypothetical protein CA267_004430 [Alteromonas pelagimontana]|uniref:Uncharacterized protein n=1 Tax=Alteromonas pelagimontana TaxID=1858656 RepID=A0A6M4MD71_9ALTE|nr:hypothetical protein [Alteromonas pelagimontana]QJR80076.1 hypothetical protein CA267_004430 [Alteromonas pelagimontana]
MDISRRRVMNGVVVTASVLALPVCWQPLSADEFLSRVESNSNTELLSEQNINTQCLAVPSFSWQIPGYPPRSQGAYRLVVANSESALLTRQGLTWDSGKVENPQVHNIRYLGDSLAVASQYFWQVEVWAHSSKFLGVSNVGQWGSDSPPAQLLTSNIQMNIHNTKPA